MPTTWTPQELSLLRGTSVQQRVERKLAQLRREFEAIVAPLSASDPEHFPAAAFSFEAYVDACSVASSRCLAIDRRHGPGFVPLVDLCNHAAHHHLQFVGDGRSAKLERLQLQLVRAVRSDQLGCQLLELRFGHQADRQLERHLVAFRQAADARPLVVTQPMKLRLRGLHLALCGTDLLLRPLHRLQHRVLLTAHLHQERGAVGRELRRLPARLLRGDELRRHAAQ